MFLKGIAAMRGTLLGLIGTLLSASVSFASEIVIDNKSDFEALVLGRELRARGVTLFVQPDGTVSGRAYGQRVTGWWTWTGGFFCRNLSLGGRAMPEDCAQVVIGDGKITFITERGQGKSAWLRLE
jgi:hypothetical protein